MSVSLPVYWRTDNEEVRILAQITQTKQSQDARLHAIFQELSAIGYNGIAGFYKKAKTKQEAEIALAVEEALVIPEQKKIIESEFTV